VGEPPGRGNRRIGYIPQQRAIDAPLRGRDLVGLGLDGHRWGTGVSRIGERRRRVAQALVSDPEVLLCDEPLLSLDLANQRVVSTLIDQRRRTANTAVLFVTHEINPVLPLVDRVLYLVDGRFRIGRPDEVMNSETLSELYRAKIDVVRVRGQIHVVGAQSGLCEDQPHHLHEEPA
jgi:zinc/manganese transport system ATP-binding protein